MQGIVRIAIRSLKFYKKLVLYQVLIIGLLCAIITGSLLTGSSVRESLKKTAFERLGNTGILISSGVRYFDQELAPGLNQISGIECTGILELNGSCQGLGSQKNALNIHIFGVSQDFFRFQGSDAVSIRPGEVAVNKKLADYLGIKPGDDLIIRYSEISDIPSDAPFAPSGDAGKSIVMTAGRVLEPSMTGNFSLAISQMTPMNIFINLHDLEADQASHFKINRLLVKRAGNNSLKSVSETLRNNLKPADIGLRFRKIVKTGEYELFSDRIFIDESILSELQNQIPESAPVITYLANRFSSSSGSTPYSFVSGIPSSLYPEIASDNGIVINSWMAHDLSVKAGDKVRMFWYSPDSLNKLKERNSEFIIDRVVDMKGIWADSLLMPDFPGISGKQSCSDWDAGVPVKVKDIRSKDEDYWNKYRGTPKAFISYQKGKELWGNNFGPATAIRYPAGFTEDSIEARLAGKLDPGKVGFIITDLANESNKAANESVDFGTLFIGLGFFLILASIVLLSFAASSYFNSKREHINTLFALGFKNSWIAKLLLFESVLTGLTGCLAGAFAGYFVNLIITMALNTVWSGAVQTNTLDTYFKLLPLLAGLILSFLTIMIFMYIKVKIYLNDLKPGRKKLKSVPSIRFNLILLIISAVVTFSLFVCSIVIRSQQLLFSFTSGAGLLLTMLLAWRHYYIFRPPNSQERLKNEKHLSRLYYSLNPSNAMTPVLFIAAGIFTLFITGANRMNLNANQMTRSGGTGGYLLWCENSVPLKEDLNTENGRKTAGLATDSLQDISFVQIKRSSGNDASCLNLNHISFPPLLGIDPNDFIKKKSFSFSKSIGKSIENPWNYLNFQSKDNAIYGIADQTVLDWGLKLKIGDTLIFRAENGRPLNVIIAAGLQSSVFQGNVLIGKENFKKYFPSVSGTQILLVDGNRALTDLYKSTLNERLGNLGINIEKTSDRLESFYTVSNTYLSVFGMFGILGMITGTAGLGFVLLRNYNRRKYDFALMLAAGFRMKKIRSMILSEQLVILFAGVFSGVVSALVATSSSIRNYSDIPWISLIVMILSIIITGLFALFLSVRSVTKNSLIMSLRKD
jgi:ABC-type antimicrobial peptide transport system permease subunit